MEAQMHTLTPPPDAEIIKDLRAQLAVAQQTNADILKQLRATENALRDRNKANDRLETQCDTYRNMVDTLNELIVNRLSEHRD